MAKAQWPRPNAQWSMPNGQGWPPWSLSIEHCALGIGHWAWKSGAANASTPAGMKLFTCSSCGQALFFENTRCQKCAHQLAYLPDLNVMSPLEPVDAGDDATRQRPLQFVALAKPARAARYRLCANYQQHDVCNWAIPIEQDSALCVSCELNVDVPEADAADARVAWVRLESAKRRMLYSLLGLGLPIDRRSLENEKGLAFSFKSSSATEPVFTGHN